jgi:hypothetical protein
MIFARECGRLLQTNMHSIRFTLGQLNAGSGLAPLKLLLLRIGDVFHALTVQRFNSSTL